MNKNDFGYFDLIIEKYKLPEDSFRFGLYYLACLEHCKDFLPYDALHLLDIARKYWIDRSITDLELTLAHEACCKKFKFGTIAIDKPYRLVSFVLVSKYDGSVSEYLDWFSFFLEDIGGDRMLMKDLAIKYFEL